MIDDFIHHLEVTTENKSLLARIYGIFTIQSKLLGKIDIIVMQNTAQLIDRDGVRNCCLEFDLKGSLFKRLTKFNHLALKVNYYYPKTLKDKNFLDIKKLFTNERDVLKIPYH